MAVMALTFLQKNYFLNICNYCINSKWQPWHRFFSKNILLARLDSAYSLNEGVQKISGDVLVIL